MIFSKGKLDNNKFSFTCGYSNLDIVQKYKYLGIICYYNGNLKHSAADLYNKGLKASLSNKFSYFEDVPFMTSIKLFDTLIKLVVCYGSEVWLSDYKLNLNNFDNLPFEKLHHKFLKCILGVRRQYSNIACRLECKREPILVSCLTALFKYYIRLTTLDHDRLLYSAFETDKKYLQLVTRVGFPLFLICLNSSKSIWIIILNLKTFSMQFLTICLVNKNYF